VVDGFPRILTESATMTEAQIDLLNALEAYLESLSRPPEAQVELYDYPVVRILRVRLGFRLS
jgi:hypothetical protein